MGGREPSEAEGLEAPPDHRRQTYQYVSDTLSLVKKRRWRAEGSQPDQCCVAKSASLDLSTRGQPTSRREPDCSRRQPAAQDRHVRRRSYKISTAASASRGADYDIQQHGKRDGSPVSTTTSTTSSLSRSDGSSTASESNNQEFMPHPRLVPLPQVAVNQQRYVQPVQPSVITVWPLACELAYRHVQSIIISDDPAHRTAPTTSDPDPTRCRNSTGNEIPLLCLLQGPSESGLCIPDVFNPTQAATWLQSATALFPVSESDGMLA